MPKSKAAPAAVKEWIPASLEERLIHEQFGKMYEYWHDAQPHRTGVHVSSLITGDNVYCERAIVLMQFFPHAKIKMFGRTLQIFLQGWVMHQKWQELFRSAGIKVGIEPLSIEQGRLRRGVTFTPDVIIALGKGEKRRRYIVEIKSMNSASFTSMRGVHKDALHQANMYMWLTGIDRAIILVENKDTQEFKLWIVKYSRSLIAKYIGRAKRSAVDIAAFENHGRLPRRHLMCPSLAAAKPNRCPVKDACFAGKTRRQKMRSTADKGA